MFVSSIVIPSAKLTMSRFLQITEALRRYGVSDSSTSLFVVRVASPDLPDVPEKMHAVVNGTIVSLSDLSTLTDWAAIKKVSNIAYMTSLVSDIAPSFCSTIS